MNFYISILLSATCMIYLSMLSMEHSDTSGNVSLRASSPHPPHSPFSKSRIRQDPLIEAIRENDLQKFNGWFESNNLTNNYQTKESPLYCSILLKRKEFTKILLQKGAIIGIDDLKIIIENPTKDYFQILQTIAPYVKQQNRNTHEIISLFNEVYDQLEGMQSLLELNTTSSSPRLTQHASRIPQRYFFTLSAFALFASYYVYLCYNENRNIHGK